MSDDETTTLEMPLVEGTIIERASDGSREARARDGRTPINPEGGSTKSYWRASTALLSLILLLVVALGRRKVVKQRMQIMEEQKRTNVVPSDGDMITKLGNWKNKCTDPAEYACGRYSRVALGTRSSFGDAQSEADVLLRDAVLDEPLSSPLRRFYQSCTAATPSTQQRPDPVWWWDRGLEAHQLSFGRARSNKSRYRYLAVAFNPANNTATPNGAENDHGTIVPKTACDGLLWSQAARLGSQASFDSDFFVFGASPDEVCSHFKTIRTKNVSGPIAFSGTALFCIHEVKRLWPTESSAVWQRSKTVSKAEAKTRTVFADAQAAIADALRQQRQYTLEQKVRAVQLHTSYVGPPEVYKHDWTDLNASSIVKLWEELLLEKETFDRSRLYFSKTDWDMAAHTINAYYWPYANAVFVTPAISRWMVDGASEAAAVGRLGFLLGHELGHAVSSNIDDETDIGLRAQYNAARLCMIQEFGVQGRTVEEDMADRIGFGVVGVFADGLGDAVTGLCPNDQGCVLANEAHVAFLAAAQCFCSTEDADYDESDTHSPDMIRLEHALRALDSARKAWFCTKAPTVPKCNVVGVPGQH